MNPQWWMGRLPIAESDYKIDFNDFSINPTEESLPKSVVEKMWENYQKTGLVLLTNTKTKDVDKMRKWAQIIMEDKLTSYKGGANSRGQIGNAVYDTGAPPSAHLHYHHEQAYIGNSVKNLAFLCEGATEGKGWMYVSNNEIATKEIMKLELGQKLREKGICYIRCLTDKQYYAEKSKGWNGKDEVGVYNHWQTSFQTDNYAEAEDLATQLGLRFNWGPNNYLKTKNYISAFELCPFTNKNVLFSSVADDSVWFDTWPGVMELPTYNAFEEADMNQRPLKMTYGDDTDFTREELWQYMHVYDKGGMPIIWKEGDVLIVCNIRWAHGRPSYQLAPGEKRKLGVVLGSLFDRRGQDNTLW